MSETYPWGTFGLEHLAKIKEGIECFNKEEFWECHEVLEDIWMEDASDQARYVYWAIIQVATSLYHVREKNLVGAHGMLIKSKEKFQICENKKIETDLCESYLSWSSLKKLVFNINEDQDLESFDQLYKFKFLNYQENINA